MPAAHAAEAGRRVLLRRPDPPPSTGPLPGPRDADRDMGGERYGTATTPREDVEGQREGEAVAFPGSPLAEITPPWASTNCFAIKRPSPSPPLLRVRDRSTRWKRLNTAAGSSATVETTVGPPPYPLTKGCPRPGVPTLRGGVPA